jgi:hypothetical protein
MFNKLIRTTLSAGTLVAVAAAGGHPLGSRPQAQAQPLVVRVDFQAVTEDGRPVTNLEPGEVTIRIAGKPRDVRALELIETATDAPAPAGPAKPPFATNVEAAAGRTLLLVLDDESVEIGREQGLRRGLTRILDGLAPGDKVGLYSVRRTGAVNIPPTTEHGAVRKAIDALQGQGGKEDVQDFRCRTVTTLQQLQSIIEAASGNTPTTIAFFSAAMMQPSDEVAQLRFEGNSDLCRLAPRNFEALAGSVAGSRAQVYVVHVPEGTTRSAADSAHGIESVSGVVGGETLRLTGDGEALAQRILGETAAYYVATVAADPSDKSGTPQRMEVRVNRVGVRARARAHVTPSRLAGAPAAGRGSKTAPRDMIRTASEFRDLPLRAAAYESRNSGDDKIRVVVLFEPDGQPATLTSAMIGLYSLQGKLIAQWSSQESDLAAMPVRAALVAPKGEYRLRVAAVDSNGRSGSVDQQIHAELESAGPLTMSTPLLGPAPAGGDFAPKLLFTSQDDAVVSYVELYSVPKGATVTATLELAPSEDAPAIGTTDAQVRPAGQGGLIVVGGFSIETLEPGDYAVRTVVSIDGQPAGRAVSTMRKSGT